MAHPKITAASCALILACGLALVAAGPATKPATKPAAAATRPAQAERRLAVAQAGYRAARPQYDNGLNSSIENVCRWSVRLMEAERAAGGTNEAALAACRAHAERMKALHERADAMTRAGLVSPTDVPTAAWYELEAEDLVAACEGQK